MFQRTKIFENKGGNRRQMIPAEFSEFFLISLVPDVQRFQSAESLKRASMEEGDLVPRQPEGKEVGERGEGAGRNTPKSIRYQVSRRRKIGTWLKFTYSLWRFALLGWATAISPILFRLRSTVLTVAILKMSSLSREVKEFALLKKRYEIKDGRLTNLAVLVEETRKEQMSDDFYEDYWKGLKEERK